jgi:type III secretion protein J
LEATLRVFLWACCTFVLAACAVPVAAGLDEPEANRVVVALDRAKIDATKEIDPLGEGKFRVTVSRDDTARALAAMQEEQLPRAKAKGILDAVDKGALVPSEASEHAQLVAGLAGELERTLEGIDGVLAARVHLNVPQRDPLHETVSGPGAPKSTASVLIEHRGATPPLTSEAVQRLVAGGVTGLAPFDVAVVTVPRLAPAASRESDLAHVGPIAVARASVRPLQLALVGLTLIAAAFAALTLVFYARIRRLRVEALEAKPKT